ncbi:mechanosensitive ion channel [bacterium]|nr:mechanosensitive ion channel [bacterium]
MQAGKFLADKIAQYGEFLVAGIVLAAFVLLALVVLIALSRYLPKLLKRFDSVLDKRILRATRIPAFALLLLLGLNYALLCLPSIGAYYIYWLKSIEIMAVLIVGFFVFRIIDLITKWFLEDEDHKGTLWGLIVKTARAPTFALIFIAVIYYALLCVPYILPHLSSICRVAQVLSIVTIAMFVIRVVDILTRWMLRTDTKPPELAGLVVKTARAPAFALVLITSLYYALVAIDAIAPYHGHIRKGAGALAVFIATLLAIRIVNLIAKWYAGQSTGRPDVEVHRRVVNTARRVANGLLWVIAFFLLLDVSDINISPLLTSLGVSGVIAAIALQNVLADLLTSFSIYLDKPFELGDYVYVGDLKGTVKKVGFYSTRLQALRGEEIVISNREMRGKVIQNFKKMTRRRVSFSIGVTYQTGASKLRAIPDMIKTIINDIPVAEADRVHFSQFGAFSLDFEIVYYLNTNNYATYMDVQQQVNLSIVEQFSKEGIEFAYPTQTIFMERPAI